MQSSDELKIRHNDDRYLFTIVPTTSFLHINLNEVIILAMVVCPILITYHFIVSN